MTKQLLFLDFETFYAERFSLKGKYALTIPEYILDERFEVIICAVAVNNGPVEVLTEPELRRFLQGLNPDETTTITHNALFDACILSWRYGFVPAYSLDTLGMARCLLAHCLKSLSLDSVAQALGEGVKGWRGCGKNFQSTAPTIRICAGAFLSAWPQRFPPLSSA